jgi:AraC-like DNA-binding protein
VTRGQQHALRDLPSTPADNFFEVLGANACWMSAKVCFGGDGPAARLICGEIENRAPGPLTTILPPILHLRGTDQEADGWARLTSRRIVTELDSGRTGSTEVANRLVDMLFLQTIRSYLDQNVETADAGWLAAVRDRQIGRARAAIHCNPRRPWTVPLLAHHLAMSRTAFASRFTELVWGAAPTLLHASQDKRRRVRLRTSRDKLTGVAAEAGYRSVAGFLRSFKRHMGTTPGENRDS